MKRISTLLVILFILNLNVIVQAADRFESPLKKYNLYDDVMSGDSSKADPNRERVMDEYNASSLRPGSNNSNGTPVVNPTSINFNNLSSPSTSAVDSTAVPVVETPKRRNEILRESSRRVYADVSKTPGWYEGPSFYSNPTLGSIREKYHMSDFAGCLQECISYVRLHPYDTLGFYYLAMSYTKVSDKDNAIAAYEKVISLNANPMIVKYATNGRNCVMDNGSEACYENVNEPDYIRKYPEIANSPDLVPIDVNTLINRNMAYASKMMFPDAKPAEKGKEGENNEAKKGLALPFGTQDADLDKFINAPYGNGLSPVLNNQYKQQQLKSIQQSINNNQNKDESGENDIRRKIEEGIKSIDRKSDIGTDNKIAYAQDTDISTEITSSDVQREVQKSDLADINSLFGTSDNDMMELLNNGEKNLSPEVIQALMIKSLTNNLSL